jgi:hypothetical protein
MPVAIPPEQSWSTGHTWWYLICIENNRPTLDAITVQARSV